MKKQMPHRRARGLKMPHTLQFQITILFTGLIVLFLGVMLLVNQFFLEDYYVSQKTASLKSSFTKLEELEDGTVPDSWVKDSSEKNLSWVVLGQEGAVVGGVGDKEMLASRLFGYLYGFGQEKVKTKVLEQTDSYLIQKSEDKFVNMDYVEIWGQLKNGNYCLIRSPLESIRESVDISKGFYLYVGVLLLIISFLIIALVTRRITKPISQLTELSQRMTSLDFGVKYEKQAGNEIDVLGENFNEMSRRLEYTILELQAANVQLQEDIEEKIRIDERRKEFLNNVSHELKTPIALVQGYAEGLKENISDDEESREFYCDVIMDEAAKMNKLVRNLLNLNQLESGADNVTMEEFDLVEVIRGVLQNSNILIQQKEAKVIFHCESPVKVWADEFKTEEVITNYFTNALNHLDEHKTVEIKILIRDARTVRVTVFNTGKAIPKEDLDQIWNKFYKVDKARTREYGGSGIGLSIVKAIMESFGQQCGVENYENGVKFWFELERR